MKFYIKTFFIVSLVSLVGIATLSAYASTQVRTTEVQIAESNVAISSYQNYPFTLYIGDDLSGVSSPALKSLHFTVSGVYTGGGTLGLSIDSDNGTAKQYTLPNVSVPTPFEIDYQDTTNKINPLSGGSYNYILNFNPTGITIYGLGIKMNETHKYTPPICADGQPANQKLKTTENIITDSDVAISSYQNYPFTLYIGDDLSGVSSPALKSLHFTVSGVYEGGGTLGLSIDSDNSTAKQYTLPNVSVPTPFEIDYQDTTNKINPLSGGSYNYNLNFNPTSITVYGLGVKMTETHKYKPVTCGGLPILGDLISSVFSATGTTNGAAYNSILWKGNLGVGDTGKVRFQFAASSSPDGPWNFYGGSTCSSFDWFDTTGPDSPVELKETGCSPAPGWNNKQYYRYKVEICSNDCIVAGSSTPVVDDIIVNWAP